MNCNYLKKCMKVGVVGSFTLLCSSFSLAFGQSITLRITSKSFQDVVRAIREQTAYEINLPKQYLQGTKPVSIDAKNMPLSMFLDKILEDQPLEANIVDRTIVLTRKEPKSSATAKSKSVSQATLHGRVVDENNNNVSGVTVSVHVGQRSKLLSSTITDQNGYFKIAMPLESFSFHFSSVGFKTEIIDGTKYNESFKVTLKRKDEELKEVVVTGIYTRSKESFTGSATTYTQKELRQVGGTNVLQSLKTLDPAFAIRDNLSFGSDPNKLANIEIRGKSSVLGQRDNLSVDPNQPLFILDGFESNLQAINDLDINRIESITILKDAASTAIYGSKAANGVVVVETVKPKPGKLQLTYTANTNVSLPDLNSYNLMDASEKLQFELLAGRYDPNLTATPGNEGYLEAVRSLSQLYNQRRRLVEEGVDSDWLSEPVQIGLNQKHSIYVMGGAENFMFGLGGGYNGISGAMKGSKRTVTNGNIDLIYRISKFQFSNKFTATSTDLSNPLVPFSEYARTNPFYKKTGDDGIVEQWLENTSTMQMANPIWNSSVNSRDNGNNLLLSNYFVSEYLPTSEFRLRGRFGLTYNTVDNERFISPEDTRQIATKSADLLGEFHSSLTKSTTYEGDITASYAKLFDKHRLNLVVGGNIMSSRSLLQGYAAEGFPPGDFGYPNFARGYMAGGKPTYIENISRSINGYLNGGYAYDDRYLIDISARTSGSSIFGSTKKLNNTWSIGLAWNMHNENFIRKNAPWIDFFKLRSSIGNPGNQNFQSGQTLLTYTFDSGTTNYFGIGALPYQVGNPNLAWQVTKDLNVGMDLTLNKKRLTLNVDYFHKLTDPLLITVDMPLSSGVLQYSTNAGEQISKGFNFTASYQIIRNLEKRILWSVKLNGRTQQIRIDKIGNMLSSFNSAGRGTTTTRYYDGSDPDDLWLVPSFGIDPSTGKELFKTLDGGYTYDYSYDNEAKVGNSRPRFDGIIGSSFTYGGFTVSANFRCQFGADVYNTALMNKVENIDMFYNQDRRALYERWQSSGDVTYFKNIRDINPSPMSSRFVQRDNSLILESLYLEYQFLQEQIKKIGLGNLRVFASAREVFRVSTVRAERGIDYPFARVVDAGLSFNF
jgi:Outer membrane receptor proteins, mostly Fe transport